MMSRETEGGLLPGERQQKFPPRSLGAAAKKSDQAKAVDRLIEAWNKSPHAKNDPEYAAAARNLRMIADLPEFNVYRGYLKSRDLSAMAPHTLVGTIAGGEVLVQGEDVIIYPGAGINPRIKLINPS